MAGQLAQGRAGHRGAPSHRQTEVPPAGRRCGGAPCMHHRPAALSPPPVPALPWPHAGLGSRRSPHRTCAAALQARGLGWARIAARPEKSLPTRPLACTPQHYRPPANVSLPLLCHPSGGHLARAAARPAEPHGAAPPPLFRPRRVQPGAVPPCSAGLLRLLQPPHLHAPSHAGAGADAAHSGALPAGVPLRRHAQAALRARHAAGRARRQGMRQRGVPRCFGRRVRTGSHVRAGHVCCHQAGSFPGERGAGKTFQRVD